MSEQVCEVNIEVNIYMMQGKIPNIKNSHREYVKIVIICGCFWLSINFPGFKKSFQFYLYPVRFQEQTHLM